MRLFSLELVLVLASACSASPCEEDERVHLTSAKTLADVCAENGGRIIVRFSEPQSEDAVRSLAEPIGATLACDAAGTAPKTCWVLGVKDGACCGEAQRYFADLGTPRASADIPHPDTPCSCDTTWTSQ
jgi:hypothetical protein